MDQLNSSRSEKWSEHLQVFPKFIITLCLGIVYIIASLSVVLGLTIWKEYGNEINDSASHTRAGNLNEKSP